MIGMPPAVLAILRLDGYDRTTFSWWPAFAGLMALAGLVALWRIVVVVWRWWTGPIMSPQRLFRELCDQHALDARERALLQQIAGEGTFDPNFLFLDAGLWSLSHPERKALHQKLFGDTSPTV